MASYSIPTPPEGVGKWQCRLEIEGVYYRLLYKWNVRNNFWYVDLADDTGVAQVRSRKLCLANDIFKQFKYKDIPQGSFDIVDTSGENREPGKDDLGSRVRVQYTDAS